MGNEGKPLPLKIKTRGNRGGRNKQKKATDRTSPDPLLNIESKKVVISKESMITSGIFNLSDRILNKEEINVLKKA